MNTPLIRGQPAVCMGEILNGWVTRETLRWWCGDKRCSGWLSCLRWLRGVVAHSNAALSDVVVLRTTWSMLEENTEWFSVNSRYSDLSCRTGSLIRRSCAASIEFSVKSPLTSSSCVRPMTTVSVCASVGPFVVQRPSACLVRWCKGCDRDDVPL